jgi:uncharacterized lipoprotein YddW (UPF0748 family)
MMGAVVSIAACATEGEPGAPSSSARAETPASSPDEPGLVVAHERELRGAWIATVGNATWPSKTGLDPAASKAELIAIFDRLASARMNTVFFQVRPESDAVYASALEPWSRFLTGMQGIDPGWDPLTFAIDEGHRRGLEVHAWLNPYRGLVNAQTVPARWHITKTLPSATRPYGSLLWMDPGVAEVRTHILEVVRDIVARYDVDGIHYDDYFYPYPVAGQSFDDAAPYAAFTAAGGTLGRDDWRRSNVDALVRETADVVAQARADVRFGVSPFGIYRPGTPPGITGLDAWATLYCDPVRWINEGWVDYLAPQLYWPTTQTAQAFGKLVTWWASLAHDGRSIFVGHDATKAGQAAYSLDEYDRQMTLVRAERKSGVLGSIFWSATPLVDDQAGLRTALSARHWPAPAATPPLANASTVMPGPPPRVTVTGRAIVVATDKATRSVAVYRERETKSAYPIDRLVAATVLETKLELEPGRWALSLIDRRGVESRGKQLLIE